MQEQRAKLITSDNTEEKYAVLLDQQIGRGGFGTVYRAVDLNNRQERLVVKIVPLEGTNRQSIQGELHILRELQNHPNLVRVKPIKCFSENNYYIMMQYCRNGTLYDQLKTKKTFTEQETINVFYQIIKGYKVLFDKKILHQDLKPENVLIDRGVYKLADFGLSIFYEGYKFTNRREGTLNYIAPQKLTRLNYQGSPLSDIFSMGVILYELVVGRHPYIRTQGKKQLKAFIQQLKLSKLTLPLGFSNNHSLKFLELFDIILRMLRKTESDRITFEEIWNYVETSQNFELHRNAQRQQSRQIIVSEYNLIVSEVSKVLTVPISTPQAEQNELVKRIMEQKKEQREQADAKTAELLGEYVIRRRIIVYFLDRLARRLVVEQLKRKFRTALYDSVIFQLLLLNRSIVNHITEQIRNPKRFTISDWRKLKFSSEHRILLDIVAKDEGYIEDSTCDFLAEDSQLSKKQLKDLFQIYKSNDIKAQLEILQKSLVMLMAQKAKFVEANVLQLATLAYLEQSERVVADLVGMVDKAEGLLTLIHEIETGSLENLRKKVQEAFTRHGIVTMMEIPELYEEFDQGADLISQK